ncbi:MAG: LysR substrate-binding domain-containing protein [Amaricoccus sp.]|uniref:LysR substrate-binding domain-containing protein n=1 Tax=Amaricoccus sp. TaxID=1872485 RepID=UPI0039E5BDA9
MSIALRVGNREETIAALMSGETDLAVMGRPPVAPDVVSEPIGPNPHLLVVPPGHRLLEGAVTADRLGAETFLLRERGSGTRILTERFLDESLGGRPYDSVELGTNETIRQGVMAGLGVAILSGNTVLGEVATGRLAVARAPGLPIVRQWFVVHLAGRPVVPAAATLARFVVENRARVLPDASTQMG